MRHNQKRDDLGIWFLIFAVTATIAFMCNGCATPEQVVTRIIDTVIRYDTLYIPTPADSSILTLDSNGTGEDTKFIVKVDTVYKTVFVKGKPQIIKVAVTDTVTKYITNNITQEKTFWGEITFADILKGGAILFIFGLVIVVINFIKNFTAR
jgi:hypothetical protein